MAASSLVAPAHHLCPEALAAGAAGAAGAAQHVAPGGCSRGSDMIVSVAAAGMLMATAAEASPGREKKRKKREPREGGSNARPSVRCAILVRRFDPPAAQQGEKSAAE